ncbi:hypothetical protein BDF14DRAFT_610394 [Spinellus fusiger]|nr:hypothetical protein BDF14DRAFT_610394 [Spinellus fusiger]
MPKSQQKTPLKRIKKEKTEVNEVEYEVEAIVGHRTRTLQEKKDKTPGQQQEYYIKWKNYRDDENTWEKACNVSAPTLIRNYWANKGGRDAKKEWEKGSTENKTIKPGKSSKEKTPGDGQKSITFYTQNIQKKDNPFDNGSHTPVSDVDKVDTLDTFELSRPKTKVTYKRTLTATATTSPPPPLLTAIPPAIEPTHKRRLEESSEVKLFVEKRPKIEPCYKTEGNLEVDNEISVEAKQEKNTAKGEKDIAELPLVDNEATTKPPAEVLEESVKIKIENIASKENGRDTTVDMIESTEKDTTEVLIIDLCGDTEDESSDSEDESSDSEDESGDSKENEIIDLVEDTEDMVEDSVAEIAEEDSAKDSIKKIIERVTKDIAEKNPIDKTVENTTENIAEEMEEEVEEAIAEEVEEAIAEEIAEAATEAIAENTTEATTETIAEVTTETIAETTAETTTEAIAEAIAEATTETTTETTIGDQISYVTETQTSIEIDYEIS